MTVFERWFLRRIIKKQVRQDYDHNEKITDLYREIRIACENEFYEDNLVTMNTNLTEWFEASLRKSTK
jgi:hypothetical protein